MHELVEQMKMSIDQEWLSHMELDEVKNFDMQSYKK